MTRADYTRGRRERLDKRIGDPRKYDILIHSDGHSHLEFVRECLGISAVELGRRMKVSYQWIRKIEQQEKDGKARLVRRSC